jgi:predicted nucleotidyltransferase
MIKEAITQTLGYAKKYHCSLSKEEIVSRLISENKFDTEKVLKSLEENNYQQSKDEAKNKKYQYSKIKRAQKLADSLSKFKNILFVGITGSVAAGYPNKDDDIDLLVICQSDTLWITRVQIKLFLLTHHIPHRRSGQKEMANQFCLNLWLDNKALKLPENKQNLKNAVDLILLVPLLNRQETYEKFVKSNDWAKRYVHTGFEKICNDFKMSDLKIRLTRTKKIQSFLNEILYKCQYFYMSKKINQELVDLHRAFFHPSG